MRKKKKIFVTAAGLKQLKSELQQLKDERLKEIAEKLKRALEFGDLSENAEYQEAKEEQTLVLGRIAELEDQIKNAELIEDKDDKATATGIVQIGSKVTLKNVTDDDDPETYTIVGSTEADPLNGRISNESPIGEAVLDRKKGETVKVKVPAGEYEYKIMKVA